MLCLYPVAVLVALPEGSGSVASRVVAGTLIAGAVAVAIAVARLAPGWIRGVAMLVVGFAGIAITAGAIA